jgi:hypothetical protein
MKTRTLKKQTPKRKAKKAVKIFLADMPIGFDDVPPSDYDIRRRIAKTFANI